MQIAKLLIIPFVCLVEHFWLGKTFSRAVIASVVTVVIGVAIVCVPQHPTTSERCHLSLSRDAAKPFAGVF